jgi:predicted acylesterase/phospholipase RssA
MARAGVGGRIVLIAVAAAVAAGCGHHGDRARATRPTCLVLSVGGPDGVAHFGAIAAIKEKRLPVAAVVGNSFGALAGALYAQAPAEDTGQRFQRLVRAYVSETERAARRNGLAAALLFGAAAAIVSEGEPVPTVLAGGGGFLLGAGLTARLDRERLVAVMGETFGGARIEALPLPFATFHQRRQGSGVELVAVRAGDLAEAVGGSVANPFLFPDMEVATAPALDPGADRVAATPAEDACRLFPGAALLVVNVTGRPAFTSAAMTCPMTEIRIAPAGLAPDEVLTFGPAYQRAVAAGYQATRAVLDRI